MIYICIIYHNEINIPNTFNMNCWAENEYIYIYMTSCWFWSICLCLCSGDIALQTLVSNNRIQLTKLLYNPCKYNTYAHTSPFVVFCCRPVSISIKHRWAINHCNWLYKAPFISPRDELKQVSNLFPLIVSEAQALPFHSRYHIEPNPICAAQLVGLIAAFAMDWCAVLFTEHLPSIICQWQKRVNPGHKGAGGREIVRERCL